jgi:hypothetical protein
VRLKENLAVTLVDARQDSAMRDRATRDGYDLDRGMLVEYAGRAYFADEAIMILSLLATPSTVFNKLTARIFRNPRLAKRLYPLLAAGRKSVVLLMGRGLIRNLEK